MTIDEDGAVRHEVVVDLPVREAFELFTELDRFKPREHNMLAVPIRETVLERRAGGAVYDRGVDGTTCRWGSVLVFEPPHTLVLAWHIGPDWQVAVDPDRASEVEISFSEEDEGRTRVTLTHRHVDRHGEGWESLRQGLDAPDGWPVYLDRYVDLAAEAA